jgi:desampylase
VVTFKFGVIEAIRKHLEGPEWSEWGGLLAGRNGQVLASAPTGNIAAEPRSEFRIDPEEMAFLVDKLDGLGFEFMGTFHSHPNGRAEMSSADAAMAAGTGIALIVGTAAGGWEWRLWDPVAGGEVEFRIAPPCSA